MTPPVSKNLFEDPIELAQLALSLVIAATVAYTTVNQIPTPDVLKDALLFVLAFYFGKTVSLNGANKSRPNEIAPPGAPLL